MEAAHSKRELARQLRAMGIGPGDTLLVHSSLRRLGAVEGRAEGLLEVFRELLGNGLLVLPALSYSTIGENNPVFSVLDTPSCVGTLPEVFRRQPGVVRSWHPTHSVAAWGPDAAAFAAGHHRFDTPCARESPWGRLWDRRGKILFIGAPIAYNTTLHGVEEWADVPGKLMDRPEALKVLTPGGELLNVPSRRHIPHASAHYAKLRDLFLAREIMREERLGSAMCSLVDVDGMVRLVLGCLGRDIRFLCHDGAGVPEQGRA